MVGENGAGNPPLAAYCGGLIGDEGSLSVSGVERRFASPREAIAAGIAVIPQELQLWFPHGRRNGAWARGAPAQRFGESRCPRVLARRELEGVGAAHIGADTPIELLTPGDRQLVAIAKALAAHARCLIMDEPTAALGVAEETRLEHVIRSLVAAGTGIVYVSHKLDEVLRLANRVTVMRDGKKVTTLAASQLTARDLVRLMVGRDIPPSSVTAVPPNARELLRVEHLSVERRSDEAGATLRDVSLSVRAGEVVGLAGLVGAGRTDFLLSLVGAHGGEVRGRVWLDGHEYTPTTPSEARGAGLVILPEERKRDGIFPQLGVDANTTLSALGRVSRWGWIDRERERDAARTLMARTRVRSATPEVPIQTLSGGNQQKALLARCLFSSPKVLLLDEPTRGIDLAARADVYGELRELAGEGFGVLLASSDMTEILTQCHRVIVFRQGAIVAEFERAEATEEKILAAASGASAPNDAAVPDPERGRARRWTAAYRPAIVGHRGSGQERSDCWLFCCSPLLSHQLAEVAQSFSTSAILPTYSVRSQKRASLPLA